DTFVALLPHKDIYSNDIFDNIIQAINDYPLKINIVLKFGIYQIEDVTIPLNVMCDRAKLATESIKGMYEVRYAYYDQSFRERMLAEQMITDNMQQALANGEFVVYYQPKYELCSEEIIGSEALVRWIHPEKGFMSPAEFIPLFEKNGFITDLDMYVWEQACKTISRLKKQGTEVHPISVNVSRIDIYNPMLTNILIDLVKKYDFEPKYLHLEITESAYTENPKQLIDVVSTLKTVGFVIEMDDFGTGYSSLNMLSELPIDMLKLDMRFLKNKATANDGNIISFIISLAKWMNLKVVAEGVETYEQVAMLRHMDCNYA
ncbi:MAG: EAL domain-containing protein, partial [Oscillospiraceae bacterium]